VSLPLAHQIHAAAEGETAPPLLIAHGLFGAARNFAGLARRLARRRRVVAVDMRNHGASPWDAACSYPALAGDLAAAVRDLCGGRASVLGHSMGGKAAMALALTEPDLLDGLIVADIAPVAYDHTHDGYVAAMAGADLSGVTRRSEVDPMLASAVLEAPLRAFLLQNLVIEEGHARWRINLDALAQGMDDLTGWPGDWPRAPHEGPALFLRGGASDYAGASTEQAIRAHFPAAEIETLPGAGHWLHAEQPDAFAGAVTRWLDRG